MLRGNGIKESFISAAILDVREIIQSFFFFYPPRPYLKVRSCVYFACQVCCYEDGDPLGAVLTLYSQDKLSQHEER